MSPRDQCQGYAVCASPDGDVYVVDENVYVAFVVSRISGTSSDCGRVDIEGRPPPGLYQGEIVD